MEKKKHLSQQAMVIMAFLALPNIANGQLLKGKVVGEIPEDAIVNYSPTGNPFQVMTTNLEFDEEGNFVYDTNLAQDNADVTIDFGVPGGYFGAHLTKGKTVEMTIKKTADGYEATFKGPNADVCRYVNRSTIAFDNMKYWAPDPSEAKPNAEYRKILEDEHNACVAMLPTIKDKATRQYYTAITENQYKWCKLRLIMDKCQEDGTRTTDNAEFMSLLKGVDVNNPICVKTNISLTALNAMTTAPMEGSNEAYCRQQLDVSNRLVTDPTLHTIMTQVIGQNYYLYGDGSGNVKKFTEDYLNFAGADSLLAKTIVNQFQERRKALAQTKRGNKAPDITLETPEGKQVQLSSLLGSKFTYIDVWATWCGPCCKEIPHLEKLVEKYKGNDKVQFISISVDADTKAWHNKLDKDKPQWAQYHLTPENSKKFHSDWGISGIPRFIMIDSEGYIYSADASRPSDAKTVETIDQQIN